MTIIGKTIGLLTILDEFSIRHPISKRMDRFVKFQCACGVQGTTKKSVVRNSKLANCGCIRKAKTKNATHAITHGYCRSKEKTGTYTSWVAMKGRCFNPKNRKYSSYGGRGITVCDRWRNSFIAFLEDMGEKPSSPGWSLERIDVNGNYCKENCRWATNREQSNNRRNCQFIEFNGKKLTHQQWAESLGFKQGGAIAFRLKSGWSIEKTLTTRKGEA